MKKILMALGAGAVAVSLNVDSSYADSSAIVNVSALNVRSGPSLNYSKIGLIYKGNSVTVIKTQGEWSYVKLSNGSKGWVYSSYIKKQASTSTQTDTAKVNVSYVNLRSGAGNSYSVKKVLTYGTKVTVLDKSGGWYNVKLSDGTTGWIYKNYIDFGGSSSSGNTSNENTSNGFTSCNGKVITYSNLNVRSGASTSYSVKAKLTYGQVVKLTDKSNGWYKVKLSNGVTGWVKDDYIKITTEGVTNSNNSNSNNNSNSYRSAVVNLAYSLIGTPYAWGGNGPNYFDCSGFTRYVYLHAEGKSIPRVSIDQAKVGTAVYRGNYLPGDLLYFDTTGNGKTSHVGIYVGNNLFIHASGSASNPDKVKLSSLSERYYSNALLGARRF